MVLHRGMAPDRSLRAAGAERVGEQGGPRCWLSGALLLLLVSSAHLHAAPTPEERREVAALRSELLRAGNLYSRKQFRESADIVRDVQQRMETLRQSQDAQLLRLLEPIVESLRKAHALLELEGIALPPLTPADAPDGQSSPAPATAAGDQQVRFARQIAPVLAEQCAGCHGGGQQVSQGFNLNTFAGLMRGGDSGPAITAGQAQDSLLVQKLKGTADGARMPRGRPPLPDETIARIETWINAGATFDGPDPNQPLSALAALDKAQRSSHEELSAQRAQVAAENWRLGMPGTTFTQVETPNFLILGNMSEQVLAQYGQQAEAAADEVAGILRVSSDQPLIKGRLTLFVFSQRYDYSEFGKMVEQRQIPRHWYGHWTYSIVDAYAALIAPQEARGEEEDDYTLEGLVSQLVASAYVASLHESVPRWFAEGAGRAVAARAAPDDPRLIAWSQQLPRILGSLGKPDDFLQGRFPPADAEIANFSFVQFLMSDVRRFSSLLDALRQGHEFPKALTGVYGGTPEQLSPLWVRWAARRRAR